MTWYPIAFLPPQYEDSSGNPYSGAVLKAYAEGTTTVISMATSYLGTTTASSFALNASGYPVSGGSVIIPHVQENYKLALYPNQAAADANSGAIWTYDNIKIVSVSEDSSLSSINDGQIAGFRNGVINGAFDVWQRGTSFTPLADTVTYTADRWCSLRSSVANYTISRQTGPDGSRYCQRVQRDSGSSDTQIIQTSQSIETANAHRYRGKKVTIRFKARKGANFSAASDLITVAVNTGTGTDENLYGGYTGSVGLIGDNVTLTTDWQTFSLTSSAAVGATITEIGLRAFFTPVGTAGAADYFEIAEVELVEGEVASTYFERLDFGTVLSRCQRYLAAIKSVDTASTIGHGFAISTTVAYIFIPLKGVVRSKPTGITVSNAAHISVNDGGGAIASTAIAYLASSVDVLAISVTVAAGLTANRPYLAYFNNASGYVLGTGSEL